MAAEGDEVGLSDVVTVETMGWLVGIFWVPHAARGGRFWKGGAQV